MFQIYAGDALVYEPGDSDLVLLTPKLTLEMGKAGSLEFTVPAGHPYTTELKQLTKPVSVSLDGETVFRGRILSGTRTFYNQREVYCEGDLSYLVDSVQKAVKYDGTAKALFTQIINNHNARMPVEKQFTVGNVTAVTDQQDIHLLGQTDDITQYDYKQVAINSIVDNWNTTFDYIETCLISYFGGYLMTRRVNNTTYIDWVSDYTNTATQEIIFGENLLDLTDETTAEDIFTVLIPIGDENLTIKSVNHDSDEIVDEAKVAKYGRIVKTNVFSNVSKAETLLENGRQYLANNGDVPTTFTLTAIDLHSVYPEVQAIRLGDRVYIRSDPHELSQYLTCTKIEYDLEKPENTVYTFGREKQTLTHRYREDKRAQNDTYGNGANGGGGIGAAAADEGGGWHWLSDDILDATDDKIGAVEDSVDQKLQDFYDAWINVDESQGTIDLGALYKRVVDDETILENNVGIKMDAGGSKIDIFADHTTLESTASTASETSSTVAGITIWAGNVDESLIEINGTITNINSSIVNINGDLTAIKGMFDTLSVDDWARFARLIYSPAVYTGGLYFDDGTEAGGNNNLFDHVHDIKVDTNGKLYLSGPEYGERQHLDISDKIKPVFGV